MRILIALVLASSTAFAVTTRTWKLTSYKEFDEGEANGVLLSSLGEAASGYGSSRIDVNESAVYCSTTGPDGTVYLGTGDQGTVYAYAKGKARKLAKLDAVLVSSLHAQAGFAASSRASANGSGLAITHLRA